MSLMEKLKTVAAERQEAEATPPKQNPTGPPPVECAPYGGFEVSKDGRVLGRAPIGPHLLWLAGTGAGKTRMGIVSQVCLWDGPVVAVSAKGDVAEYSAELRAEIGGPMYVMDLTGQVDWSKLPETATPIVTDPCALLVPDADGSTDDSALEIAELLIQVGQLSGNKGGGDGEFWAKLATGTLACLLQAGAGYPDPETGEWVGGGGIAWVRKAALNPGDDEDEDSEVIDLDTPSWDVAANRADLIDSDHVGEVEATKLLDPKQRDSVGINLRVALGPWSKRAVRGKPGAVAFSPEMVEEPNATLYIVSPQNGSAAGAAASVVESLVAHWTRHAMTKGLPPIAMVIDECPQICPLPQLPAHISLMRSYGMHFLVAAQSSSQFRKKLGKDSADVLLDVFPSILVGVGALEKELLDRAAGAEGMTERQVASYDANGRANYSTDRVEVHWSELLPQHPGEAQLLYRGRTSMMVKLVDFSEM